MPNIPWTVEYFDLVPTKRRKPKKEAISLPTDDRKNQNVYFFAQAKEWRQGKVYVGFEIRRECRERLGYTTR